MWGLDAADSRTAIEAMQAMNQSVRNVVFFPAFFLTPVVLVFSAIVFAMSGLYRSAIFFGLAAGLYTTGALVPTALVNVPMNEALASITIPANPAEAARIWAEYSPKWQLWNQLRTVASGVALLLTGYALISGS
ncbi:DUF1772 domain-containing protein [Hoeflea prorocentri]